MQFIIEAIRKRYSPNPTQERAASLDKTIRKAMAKEIEETLKYSPGSTDAADAPQAMALAQMLIEVQTTVEDSYSKLQSFEKTEEFVGLRLQSYRQQLVEHKDRPGRQKDHQQQIGDETDRVDNEVEERQQSQETTILITSDEEIRGHMIQNLRTVEQAHKQIQQNVLQMKQNIQNLEQKMEDIRTKQRECIEFLQAVKGLEPGAEAETTKISEIHDAGDTSSATSNQEQTEDDMV